MYIYIYTHNTSYIYIYIYIYIYTYVFTSTFNKTVPGRLRAGVGLFRRELNSTLAYFNDSLFQRQFISTLVYFNVEQQRLAGTPGAGLGQRKEPGGRRVTRRPVQPRQTDTYIYIYIHTCVCVYIYIYIYIYTQCPPPLSDVCCTNLHDVEDLTYI